MMKLIELDNGRKQVFYNNVLMQYERRGNDVYGNPLYRVYPINFSFKRLKSVYRNYEKGAGEESYYLIQSYNILADIRDITNEVNAKNTFPEFGQSLLKDYQEVSAYV
ncbi:hypothetical protein AB0Y53_21865 [Parabacteroides distasonis]|uniref:hypothetical protein n=1 Tax=Parabacteroides distasonis TaxID=823 RepID=UPI003F1FD621